MKKWWLPLAIYIILVFCFGYYYSKKTNEFYFSTIAYEDSFVELKNNVRNSLLNGVKYSFERKNNTNIIMYNDFVFNTSHTFIHNLEIHDRTIIFQVSIEVEKSNKFYKPTLTLSYTLWPNYTFKNYINLLNRTKQILKETPTTDSNPVSVTHTLHCNIENIRTYENINESEILNLFYYDSKKSYEVRIEMLNESYFDVCSLIFANQGFPHNIPNKFVRMLYFSAVTITTLGYGDIVPVTDSMRIAIFFETVFGVILIGWFLFNLANKISKEK